ncbi:MAG TPA: tRNA (adenosine(37)-N6)-dimethylallyltransferase MiaA [Candidatus Sumerlaeota bacterium]|nr:tRNA (adenosine(37)-N6)-dimethylallyltransferase MiaA [Candidatus Sumerlaeota bacterium]
MKKPPDESSPMSLFPLETLPSRPLSPLPILLAGPTATGKTALAIALARRLGGEIISADSMQVYRGCVIGTAQATPEELDGIPCHLTGCVEPDQTWTVADWLREVQVCIHNIINRGHYPIVAGGTGLYFKALTTGLFQAQGAGRDPERRARLEREWDEDRGTRLHARLNEVDPDAARRIHPNDRLRVVRALEVYEASGQALSQLQARDRHQHPPLQACRFVLTANRPLLYSRIDRRVEEMMRLGFAEEVEQLAAQGATEAWPAMRALGYPQVLRWLRGETTREAALEETQRLSRRYAKQQIVLLRQWPGALWLDAPRGVEKNSDIIQKILEFSPPLCVQ